MERAGSGGLSLIALDLATATGWSLCGPAVAHFADRPWLRRFSDDLAWGTLDLDRGMRAAQLRALDDFLEEVLPACDHLIRETIYDSGDRKSAARVLIPMADAADFQAKQHQIESWTVHPAVWRKHFLGRGTGKREDLKQLAMERCRILGWEVTDDNQAEALGLMDYSRACFGLAATLGPLSFTQ